MVAQASDMADQPSSHTEVVLEQIPHGDESQEVNHQELLKLRQAVASLTEQLNGERREAR